MRHLRLNVIVPLVALSLSCAGPVRPPATPCHGAAGLECGHTLFDEQPISTFSNTVDKVYRCWLDPGWGPSDVVRVEQRGAKYSLVHKDLKSRGTTSESTRLKSDYIATTRMLSDEDWTAIEQAVAAVDFWEPETNPSTKEEQKRDCPKYVAEGAHRSTSQTIITQCPEPNTQARICDALFTAAGIETGW